MKWLTTDYPQVTFEGNTVERLKKKIWDVPGQETDKILEKYEIPSEPELEKANIYIQNTQSAQKNHSLKDGSLFMSFPITGHSRNYSKLERLSIGQ